MYERPAARQTGAFGGATARQAVLLILGLVAAGLLFKQLAGLLLLVITSVIIALPLSAGASFLQRFRVPRAIGAVLTLLLFLGALGGVLALLAPSFVDQVNAFVQQIPSTLHGIDKGARHAFGLKPGTITGAAQRFVHRYTQDPTKLLAPLSSIGFSLASALAGIVVVLISSLYMAISPGPLINGLLRLLPPAQRPHARAGLARIQTAWLGWLRGVVIDMLVLGGLLFAGMTIIGLPFAVGFAVFSALLTVIPNYGSVISAVPPILYGLSHSLHLGILVAVVYIVVNQFEGNVLLPVIMGRTARMHPAVVAVGVLVAGSLFGLVGLFIAVPLISLTLILVEECWIKPQENRGVNGSVPAASAHPGISPPNSVYGAILLGAILVVLGLLAQALVTLLVATLVTIILSLPLGVCAGALERRGVPRPLGALIGLLAGLGVTAAAVWLLIPKFVSQGRDLINSAPHLVQQVEVQVGHITGQRPGHVAATVQHAVVTYVHQPSHLLGPLASIGLSAATILGGLVIAVMVAFYIAASPHELQVGLVRLFPPWRRANIERVMARLRTAWLGWMRGLAMSSLLIGLLLYLALSVIVGLPYALPFSVVSAVAEIVPYLGALVSGIPVVAYALTISPGTAIEVLVIYIAVHQIESNIIAPVVMGRSVHLHPAVISFGVIAIGELCGFLGLLVAVPILSGAIILVEESWVRPREQRAGLDPTAGAGTVEAAAAERRGEPATSAPGARLVD